MSADDLIERLRVDDPWCQPKCDEAADRIAALEAERDRLRKGCECAMNEIRDYMVESGGTLPLELAMGWLSTALEAKP